MLSCLSRASLNILCVINLSPHIHRRLELQHTDLGLGKIKPIQPRAVTLRKYLPIPELNLFTFQGRCGQTPSEACSLLCSSIKYQPQAWRGQRQSNGKKWQKCQSGEGDTSAGYNRHAIFWHSVMRSLMYQDRALVTLRISHQGDWRLGKSPCEVELNHLHFPFG